MSEVRTGSSGALAVWQRVVVGYAAVPVPVGVGFQPGPDPRRGPGFRAPKPRALPDYIREKTKKGKALVEWLVAIADGSAEAQRQVSDKEGKVVTLVDHPTHRERLAAIRELWDRGMGSAIPSDKMPEPETPEPAGGDADGSIEPPKLGAA